LRSLYKIITGPELLIIDPTKREPLVEGFIYKKDYIMLEAEPKVGKTILTQHLTSCMSKGTPFLGLYDIPKPLRVWYFATEGKEDDLKERFSRMVKAIPMDCDNIFLIPTCFPFNTARGILCLNEIMEKLKDKPPDIIIIDSVYRAIAGKLTDEAVINSFHHQMAILQNEYGCAILLVHHMTKPSYDPASGKKRERGDFDGFGSIFLSAAVDHVFRIEKMKKDEGETNDRILKCNTQRSGEIVNNLRLRLIEPDPLYFETVSLYEKEAHIIMELIKVNKLGISIRELIKKSSISRSIVFAVLGELKKTHPEIQRTGKEHSEVRYIYVKE
jgi:hypothetical protein